MVEHSVPSVLLAFLQENGFNFKRNSRIVFYLYLFHGFLLQRRHLRLLFADQTDLRSVGQNVGIRKLDGYILHELVKAIYVESPRRVDGKKEQRIHIEYNGIGFIPIYDLIEQETA